MTDLKEPRAAAVSTGNDQAGADARTVPTRPSALAATVLATLAVAVGLNLVAFPYFNGDGFAFGMDDSPGAREGYFHLQQRDGDPVMDYMGIVRRRAIREQVIYLHLADAVGGRSIVVSDDSPLDPVWLETLSRMEVEMSGEEVPAREAADTAALAATAEASFEVGDDTFVVAGADDDGRLHLLTLGSTHFIISEALLDGVTGRATP